MKHFQKLHDGADTVPLLNALNRQKNLWNEIEARKNFPKEYGESPHREADDIILRGQKLPDGELTARDLIKVQRELQCYNYPAFYKLPQIRQFVFGIMTRLEGEQLGRIMITKLAPGNQIYEHKDTGIYSEHYNRYHCVLQSFPGSIFYIEDEQVNMKTGEVWWVDKLAKHSVKNNSSMDRIHLIVDIRIDN